MAGRNTHRLEWRHHSDVVLRLAARVELMYSVRNVLFVWPCKYVLCLFKYLDDDYEFNKF